jgi:hypothetical protein
MPLLGFFLILSFFSVCYVNWAAPAYFTAFVLAVASVREGRWRVKVKRWGLTSALLLGTIISFLAFNLDTVRAVGVALGADIPAEKFPTSRLQGWHELGAEVSKLLNEEGGKNTFILSYKRDYVSELAFYVEGHPTVYILNLSGRIESQYDLWQGFKDKIGFNALYITDLDSQPPAIFNKAFSLVKEIKKVRIYTGKEFIKGFSLFYCKGFRGLGESK